MIQYTGAELREKIGTVREVLLGNLPQQCYAQFGFTQQTAAAPAADKKFEGPSGMA